MRKPTEVQIAIEESVFCVAVDTRGTRRGPNMDRHWEGKAVNFRSAESADLVGVASIGASLQDFSMTIQYQYRLRKQVSSLLARD